MPVEVGPFGVTLRRLRERAGLTQEQLAEAAGLSPRAIRALERGERRQPYPHTVSALATALGLTDAERRDLRSSVQPRGTQSVVPVAPTRLIGRDQDLRAILDAVTGGETRLITLTGPGGVGKTQLALAAAHELGPRFDDGALFVSLAELRDPAGFLPVIAHHLGLREGGTQPLDEVLHGYLRHRRMLIVLDNFEHVLAAGTRLARLLASAPRLGVLTTSRSPLRLRGEHVLPVQPLTLDAAVELFVERSRQSAAESSVSDLPAVADICRRLDGLPLAVELAAARARVLPAPALLARLDQSLGAIGQGARDLPARQQTLQNTLDWSYHLLNSPEQTMFRRLAVFSGGWTLEAAAAIARVDDVTAFNLHERLLDSSLISREFNDGQARFRVLETVRSYALDRLDASDEADSVRARHTLYYRDLAATGMPNLYGSAQPGWLDQLEREHDNLRVVCQRMLDQKQLEDLTDMCLALYLFWLVRDHFVEGEGWADNALGADRGSLSPGARAKLLLVSAGTLYARSRYQEAAAKYERAATLAREADDPQVLTWVLVMSGYVAVWQGQPQVAIDLLDGVEALVQQLGDGFTSAHSCIVRAQAAITLGRTVEGDCLLTKALSEIRNLDPWTESLALSINGFAALLLGDHSRAELLVQKAATNLHRVHNTSVLLWAVTLLALTAVESSDPRRAAQLLGVTETMTERTGASIPPLFDQLVTRGYRRTLDQLGADAFNKTREQGRRPPARGGLERWRRGHDSVGVGDGSGGQHD